MKYRILFFLLVLIPAFANANDVMTSYINGLPPFKHISISGPVNVTIDGSRQKQSVEIIGDPRSVAQTEVWVEKGYLYINMNKNYKPGYGSSILVKVNTPVLGELAYDGVGTVTGRNLQYGPTRLIAAGSGAINISGKNINVRQIYASGSSNICINEIDSANLIVQHPGTGDLSLNGKIVLQRIDFGGKGALDLKWIDSSYVKINGSGQGQLKVAGQVGLLDVSLNQNAYLDARYLRVQRGFVSTADHSTAHVSIKKMLGALSSGNSTIYYYNDSNYVGGYMQPAGSVLRMTGIQH